MIQNVFIDECAKIHKQKLSFRINFEQNVEYEHSLSTPMGVDYVVIGFDMEVQPLVTHNAA